MAVLREEKGSSIRSSRIYWLSVFAIACLAVLIGYPQPSLKFREDILPLVEEFISTQTNTPKHKHKPLEGLNVVVTGATSGIGLGLTGFLSILGATVIAVGRNSTKLSSLQEKLPTIVAIQAESSDLQSVSKAADEILFKMDSIDVLVNNAGINYGSFPSRTTLLQEKTTSQGFDLSFGVNYLSHFLLTEKLLPHIQNSTYNGGTVLQVSSSFHWGVDGSDLFSGDDGSAPPLASLPRGWSSLLFRNQRAYANSKLAQILHMRSLQRRFPSIRFKSSCPCWVGTHIAGGGMAHFLLQSIAFPYNGHGLKSSLIALFSDAIPSSASAVVDDDDANNRSNEKTTTTDFVTNSAITDFIHPFTSILRQPWAAWTTFRDGFVLSFALLMLFGEKLQTDVAPRKSSPESYDENLQESLYKWSYSTVESFL